jgi:hypothetical protein
VETGERKDGMEKELVGIAAGTSMDGVEKPSGDA